MVLAAERTTTSLAPLTTRAAKPALKAVPLRIPRCSLDARGRGDVFVRASALGAVYVVEKGAGEE